MAVEMASAFLRITMGRSLSRLTLAVSARNEPTIAAIAQRHLHRNHALLGTMNIEMPSLSPTMTEGTIVKWHKKEGDSISPGDVLCDIQTDKAVVSMDTEEEGILAKIILPENSKDVKIGTLIALMVDEGDDWQSVNVPQTKVEPVQTPAAPATAPAAELFHGTKVTMPSLSPTMTEGTLVKWHKKEGDVIAPGDLLCDIQTDKAVVSMDLEEEGILAKILMPEGSKDVKIGQLIALIVDEGEDWQNVTIPVEGAEDSVPSPAAAAPPPAAAVAPGATPAVEAASMPKIEAIHSLTGVGPSVKKLLEEYHISPTDIKPTGPKGHLLKGDILSEIKNKNLNKVDLAHLPVEVPKPAAPVMIPAAPAPSKPLPPSPPPPPATAATFIDTPTTNMRKVIARRLTESKTTIPHSYGSVECNVGNALKLRKQLMAENVKVSMNDFIIKAAALALQRVPEMNATLQGDTPVQSESVDISIAVATPNGLITPIIQDAANLGVGEISSKVKDLAGRAREGKLQLHEFQGGSFSISNLGMFGITEFTAVINPPQAAILAIGTSCLIPGIAGPVNMMTATLSYDRRAVDEYEAARFLEVFREIMENPNVIISGMSPVIPPSQPPVDPPPPPPPTPKPSVPESNNSAFSHLPNAESLARDAFIKSLTT